MRDLTTSRWVPDRQTAVAALSLLRSDLDLADELTPNRDRMLKTVMEYLSTVTERADA